MREDGQDERRIIETDLEELQRQRYRHWEIAETDDEGPYSYRMKLGRLSIELEPIEFRILAFLAARPYHPYSRRSIAEAVTSPREPVDEDAVDGHISSLRSKLGFFNDYIRAVPQMGYCFKA